MGKRGPRPTPTATKKRRGTYRPDRAPKNEAKPDGDAIPPEWLSKRARGRWPEIVPQLTRCGLATSADEGTLGRYVELLCSWLDARDDAARHVGEYHRTQAGAVKPHPSHEEVRKYHRELLAIEREFGMTPSARTRIEIPGEPGEPDAWAKRNAG